MRTTKTMLFFDTETTGLPNFKAKHSAPGQPHICQLGAILTDGDFNTKAELNLIIQPQGWTISKEASDIHGITQRDAEKFGVSIKGAMAFMKRMILKADLVLAHNIVFDKWLLRREAELLQMHDFPFEYDQQCTMELTKDYLKIPPTAKMVAAGFNTYKNPTMQEAYTHYYGKPFDGAHDAMADVRACRDVYKAVISNLMPIAALGETA